MNRGLPGNLVSDGTMMLSLLRSTRITAYGYQGGYEPGMTADAGLELGKERVFDYALVPHQGDWRQAAAFRHGLEFNHPLLVRKVLPHAGPLPKRWGLLEISQPSVVLSALVPGPGASIILRVYEATGKPASGVTVRLSVPVAAAREVNLMEDPVRNLDIAGDALTFDLRAFEIKTFRIDLPPCSSPGKGPG